MTPGPGPLADGQQPTRQGRHHRQGKKPGQAAAAMPRPGRGAPADPVTQRVLTHASSPPPAMGELPGKPREERRRSHARPRLSGTSDE